MCFGHYTEGSHFMTTFHFTVVDDRLTVFIDLAMFLEGLHINGVQQVALTPYLP